MIIVPMQCYNALVNFMPHPPPPGVVGEYRGFDKSWCQIPHYWGKIGSQIPTMSPPPSRGFDNTSRISAYFMHATNNCDRISHNKASTHTKSNFRFYQKWIAGLTHYHISHCTSISTDKSGFCSSFLPTLSKPRV